MRDMLGRGKAVSVDEALRLISETLPEKDIHEETVAISEAFGRVLSSDVISAEDLPGFSRAIVDGYAVLSGDTFGSSETSPAYLDLMGDIPMGHAPDFELLKGKAARIATGGMLPAGSDAVVMFEHVQGMEGSMIEIHKAVAPGENVIRKGEDVKAGESILKKGRRLRPHDVALLAGAGLSEVRVYARPVVSVISTGDEVVPVGAPLEPGKIRDMNSISLAGMVLEDGGIPVRRGIVKDNLESLKSAVEAALVDSDMVLITGGSSVGARDVTEKAIGGLGRILFHSVSMKPGKPLMAGLVGDKPVFGLPGHPRAVSVCYEVFIRPVIGMLSGVRHGSAWKYQNTVRARLSKSISSTLGRQEVVSVALAERNGELWAEPILGKSGLLSMLVRADGTVTVPEGKPGLKAGDVIEVKLF